MYWGYTSKQRFCRWCGKQYTAKKPVDRDGFCCFAHKQAHYRAYKKYVTAKGSQLAADFPRTVTRKKRKKSP